MNKIYANYCMVPGINYLKIEIKNIVLNINSGLKTLVIVIAVTNHVISITIGGGGEIISVIQLLFQVCNFYRQLITSSSSL